MRAFRQGAPYFFLRVGLGITLAWIGVDMLRHPDAWIGFIPSSLLFGLEAALALKLAALGDIVLGLLLLSGFFVSAAAALTAIHLAAVLVFNGIDAVLIRDVGLVGAALSLFFIARHPRRYR